MREPQNGDVVATAPVTTEQSVNKLFYETDIEVPVDGIYEVAFQIHGSEGDGTIVLEVNVKPPSRVNWFVIGMFGLGVVLLLGWWRSRRA